MATTNPDQQRLRLMNSAERAAYIEQRARQLSTGLNFVKLDGHIAASGEDDEIDLIRVRFDAYIDGPDRPARTLKEGFDNVGSE